jgi:undecaprenyl-diphosphatase
MATNWLMAVIEGAVEGVTEFIPVSSTGHLLITERLLNVAFSDLFNIVIQSGAVVAVLPLFRGRLTQFAFGWRERDTQVYLLKILLAFMITAIGGLVLERQHFELPNDPLPIALALLVGGVGFLVAEYWLAQRRTQADVTWAMAAAVGAAQLVAAVFPGTSRSGATILILLLMSLGRPAAIEFSFLVGIPTMLAAGGLKIFSAVRQDAPHEAWSIVAAGTLASAAVSFVVVKWLLAFVRTHTFQGFGWYRIALGLLLLGLVATGVMARG